MARLQIKGFIKEISSIETVGENHTKKQAIILSIPPRKDEVGDPIGKEETWCVFAFGTDVDRFKLTDTCSPGDKCELTFYINSYFIEAKPETDKKKKDGRPAFFSQNNTLISVTILP